MHNISQTYSGDIVCPHGAEIEVIEQEWMGTLPKDFFSWKIEVTGMMALVC